MDCPGYGFAKAPSSEKENWKKFMMVYLSQSKKLHRCIMLIDASVGLQDNDKMLIDLLTEM